MTEPAISVRHLAKCYQLGTIGRHTLVEEVEYYWHRLRGRNPQHHMAKLGHSRTEARRVEAEQKGSNEFWALQDVTFEVQPGEVMGIVGSNGAGKSTLLKILTRITEPTTGEAFINGRVASLLEVGTGFHPELTGRENVYMNGTILGMKKREIDAKFDEIVAFSELEKFIETPVKRYSSGMYVRLAFAVAAHLEPEILIIDEVLAVGDASFQKKCLGKMGDVAKQGRTVLFVSHNMTAVQGLCSRAIWLNQGLVVKDGSTEDVVGEYQRASYLKLSEQHWNDPAQAPGNNKMRLHSACVFPEGGLSSDPITVRTPVRMEFELWNLKSNTLLNLSVNITNDQGITIFSTVSIHAPDYGSRPLPAGLFRFGFTIPGDLMNDGAHNVEIFVVQDQRLIVFRLADVLAFDVLDTSELRGNWHGKWPGAMRPQLSWDIIQVKEAPL